MRSHISVSGQCCLVSPLSRAGLGAFERRNAPVAEVFAPEGYEFSGGETSLCVHKAADLANIEACEILVSIDVFAGEVK